MEEALLVSLVESSLDYDDAAKRLPDRTAESCRAHYYPRLRWQRPLNDKGNNGDGLGKDSREDVEDDLTQNLDEDSEDEIMQVLEQEIESAYIHDSEDDIKDGAFQESKTPTASLSGDQTGRQRAAFIRKRWSPEGNAILIKLRADGMKFKDISKQFPGHSLEACKNQYYLLTKEEKAADGIEPVQKLVWSEEGDALIRDG